MPVPKEEEDLHSIQEWIIYENKLQCRPKAWKDQMQAQRNDMFRIGKRFREEDEDG